MKTRLASRLFSLFVFAVAAQALAPQAAAQQADNPVYVNLSFRAYYYATDWMSPGEMGVSIQDETGAWVEAWVLDPYPFQWMQSITATAKLYPNKNYTLSMLTGNGEGYVRFEPMHELGGQPVFINGVQSYNRTIGPNQSQNLTLRVGVPRIDGKDSMRAGASSSIAKDKPFWYLGLGRLRNGDSAGMIGFRRQDFSDSNFFKPGALVYDSPDPAEVDVIRQSGVLRQVFSREALVDIQTVVSGTSYKLDVYPRSQVTGYSGGLHTTTGSPFVTYTVSKITPSGGTGVKIVRYENTVYWETSLEQVSTTWTHRDWRVQGATAESKVVTNYTTTTSATVSHNGLKANGSGTETALTWKKTFTQHVWGKELNQVIYGEGGDAPLETQHVYYTTDGSGALAARLKRTKHSDGSWTKLDYHDTNTTSGDRGLVKRVYRQWLDTSSNPDSPGTGNSAYEDWTYALAIDGSYRLPYTRIERAPGGTILSRTDWAYNHAVTTLNGKTIAQSIRYDYWGTGGTDRVATTTRYHRESDSSPYHRLKPVSVQHPDGAKDSYAYFNGTWSESTRTFTASSGGNDRLVLCYHGQISGGTAVSSATNNGITWSMDTVYMVAGKSTVSERVIDTHGRLVFEGRQVRTPAGGFERIAGMLYRYDLHGRLVEEVDTIRSVGTSGGDELKSVRTWSVGLLLTETAPEGRVTKFEYDNLLRLEKRTDGFGGSSGFPGKVSEFKYDGANRLAMEYPAGSLSDPTIYGYDPAGRLESKAEAAPGGGDDLTTSFEYTSVTSTTTTFPNGGTRVATNFLDGRPKSITGTAQPPATFEYVVESTGLKITSKNGTDTTNGWVETKHDLLGRLTVRSVPTWGWPSVSTNNVLETRFEYNTARQLWRERTYYRATASYVSADRILVYDAGGRLWRRGLDVNNSATLTTNSNDRITDVDETISQDSWGWTLVTTVKTYATDGSSTATEVSRVHQRLRGFNNGSKSGSKFVIGDVISFDSRGRWSLQWDYANPTSKSIESDFMVQGQSQGGYRKGNNGYLSETLSLTGQKEGYEYDSLGRLSHVRGRWTGSSYAEDTAYTYHEYTGFVETVTHGGIATGYTYAWDAQNERRTVTVTDAAEKKTHTRYNTMDLPSQVWGTAAQPVEFDYDDVGRRKTMTTWRTGTFSGDDWPGSPGTGAATKWHLEKATGLLEEKEWADHAESPTSDNRKWTYTYTPLGNVATREWARVVSGTTRVKTTYAYFDGSTTTTSDISHRTHELRAVTYNDGTTATSYKYKRTGAPYEVTDFTGTRTFAYRSDLQLSTETLGATFYGSGRTITPTYEIVDSVDTGRATGFQFKTGGTVESGNTFTFDASTGRIQTVAAKDGSPTFTYGYTTGTDWVGTVTSGSYNRTNTLLSNRRVLDRVETKWSTTVRSDYDSTFDSRGLRATVFQQGTIPTDGTTTFTYNERAELTKAIFSVGTSKDYEWTYDLMGKRTEAKRAGSNITTYNAADADEDVNQYASITGDAVELDLAYDADGNMTQDGTWHYRYDGENRLKEMEKKNGTQTLQLVYDYLNRRVRKTVRSGGPTASITSSTKFVWTGWKLTAELNAGTTDQSGTGFLKSYLWGVDFSNASGAAGGAGALLAVYQGGAWYHTAYDATGNLTGYLNTSGTAVATYEYNAYGQIIASGGSATSFAFGFATQYTDHESGLVYYGRRYYQPKHGRFMNRDPIEEEGGLNLYSFVRNSPSNRWDVLGLLPYKTIEGDRTIINIPVTGVEQYIRLTRQALPIFLEKNPAIAAKYEFHLEAKSGGNWALTLREWGFDSVMSWNSLAQFQENTQTITFDSVKMNKTTWDAYGFEVPMFTREQMSQTSVHELLHAIGAKHVNSAGHIMHEYLKQGGWEMPVEEMDALAGALPDKVPSWWANLKVRLSGNSKPGNQKTTKLVIVNVEAGISSRSPIAQAVYWGLVNQADSVERMTQDQMGNLATANHAASVLQGYEWLVGDGVPLGLLPSSLYFARFSLLNGDHHTARSSIYLHEALMRKAEFEAANTQ